MVERGELVERRELRICPVRDIICPHGMACPYTAGWNCTDPALRGRNGYHEPGRALLKAGETQ